MEIRRPLISTEGNLSCQRLKRETGGRHGLLHPTVQWQGKRQASLCRLLSDFDNTQGREANPALLIESIPHGFANLPRIGIQPNPGIGVEEVSRRRLRSVFLTLRELLPLFWGEGGLIGVIAGCERDGACAAAHPICQSASRFLGWRRTEHGHNLAAAEDLNNGITILNGFDLVEAMRREVTEGQLSSAHGVMVAGGRNNVNALQSAVKRCQAFFDVQVALIGSWVRQGLGTCFLLGESLAHHAER
jgi:hypothetical protein